MTYKEAVAFLGAQDRRLRKIDKTRFTHDGYEYRLVYEGGFAPMVSIERRQIGKRNFKYFGGVGVFDCWTIEDAMSRVMDRVNK